MYGYDLVCRIVVWLTVVYMLEFFAARQPVVVAAAKFNCRRNSK